MKCLGRKQSTMGHGIYSAAAGAIARRTQLDMVANNLANANTTGYREQRVTFEEVLRSPEAPNRHLVAVGHPTVSAQRGPIQTTGRVLDLAIQHEGYFVAQDNGGPVLLSSVSAQLGSDGKLRDPAGRPLAFAGGDTRIDPASPVEVGDNGQIIQHGREVARLLVVGVSNPRGLAPVGAGGYTTTLESGMAHPTSAQVVSRGLEQSNVNPVTNMVRMIALEREFQSLTRVINAYREADDGILEAASNS